MTNKRPRMFDLVAINEETREVMNLGHPSEHVEESVRYRVLVHAMFWGAWQGKRVRIISSTGSTVAACTDVTAALATQYVAKHGKDVAAFALTAHGVTPSPTGGPGPKNESRQPRASHRTEPLDNIQDAVIIEEEIDAEERVVPGVVHLETRIAVKKCGNPKCRVCAREGKSCL